MSKSAEKQVNFLTLPNQKNAHEVIKTLNFDILYGYAISLTSQSKNAINFTHAGVLGGAWTEILMGNLMNY